MIERLWMFPLPGLVAGLLAGLPGVGGGLVLVAALSPVACPSSPRQRAVADGALDVPGLLFGGWHQPAGLMRTWATGGRRAA